MTELSRERAELKSFITGFLTDPTHDNQSINSMTAKVFRIALTALDAEAQEPVADAVAWSHPNEERTCDIRLRRHDVKPGPLYAAPQPAAELEKGSRKDGVETLVMLVKRLAWSLRQAKPDSKTATDAMEYLKRENLIGVGDILR